MMRHLRKEDILEGDADYRKNLINSLSGYKSLNLIGTKSQEGISNLALFSQVFHIGANPPLVGILFRPDTVVRHTLRNILETNFFTLNHVSSDFFKQAHWTSARWENSEFDATGLGEEYLNGFFAPYVFQSRVKLACKFIETQTIQVNQTILMIGSIEDIYVEEVGLRTDGSLDLNELDTVTVSGLDEYHIGRKLARLGYAKPHKQIEEI
jgi:flavin reductase (DIM6/NTAB) family NADH-FMN oxidoreductase RutF